MALQNGLISGALLTSAEGTAGARLRPGAAAAWAAVRRGVSTRYGWTPTLTSAADAYRSYEIQRRIFLERYQTARVAYLPGRYDMRAWNGTAYWRKPGTAAAAVPGTSNHGWGRAVDVALIGAMSGDRYKQFAAVAGPLGWSNAEGRSVNEPWHWVFTGDLDLVSNPQPGGGTVPVVPNIPGVTPIAPIEEDIVASLDDLRRELAPLHARLDALDIPEPLYRLDGGGQAAYRDLGGALRHISGAQFDPDRQEIRDLPATDPLWRLPFIDGIPGETYQKRNDPTKAVYTIRGGRLHHLTPEEYAAIGRVPFVVLDDTHPLWVLPAAS